MTTIEINKLYMNYVNLSNPRHTKPTVSEEITICLVR